MQSFEPSNHSTDTQLGEQATPPRTHITEGRSPFDDHRQLTMVEWRQFLDSMPDTTEQEWLPYLRALAEQMQAELPDYESIVENEFPTSRHGERPFSNHL